MTLLPPTSSPLETLLRRSVTTERLRDSHSAINQPSQDTITNAAIAGLRYNGDYLTFQEDFVLYK